MTVSFVAASKKIVHALERFANNKNLEGDDRIRFIYNNAIEDAISFVRDMGNSNPDIRLACMRLENEMREWLPLREALK